LVDEEFYQLVNFIVDARDPYNGGKTNRIFIDTAIDFSSGKALAFNASHIKDLNDLRTQLNKIYSWYKTATCLAYVEDIEKIFNVQFTIPNLLPLTSEHKQSREEIKGYFSKKNDIEVCVLEIKTSYLWKFLYRI
jgi:hypothetical protein